MQAGTMQAAPGRATAALRLVARIWLRVDIALRPALTPCVSAAMLRVAEGGKPSVNCVSPRAPSSGSTVSCASRPITAACAAPPLSAPPRSCAFP